MVDIDYVMELMDWNNSIEDQKKGVELARNIKCLNAFLQPGAPCGKSVWENCAKVLTERTNKELVSFTAATTIPGIPSSLSATLHSF